MFQRMAAILVEEDGDDVKANFPVVIYFPHVSRSRLCDVSFLRGGDRSGGMAPGQSASCFDFYEEQAAVFPTGDQVQFHSFITIAFGYHFQPQRQQVGFSDGFTKLPGLLSVGHEVKLSNLADAATLANP